MGLLVRAAVFVIAGGALAAAIACSSFGSDDSSDPDAGVGPDSGVAPPVLVDAAADTSCSWFCDDFDHGFPEAGWNSGPTQTGGGLIGLAGTPYAYTAPHSLEVFLDPKSSGGSPTSTATHSRSELNAVKSVHCTIDIQLRETGNDVAGIFSLDAKSASGNGYELIVYVGSKGIASLGETGNPVKDPMGSLPTNAWTRVGLDFALGTATRITIGTKVVNHEAVSPAGKVPAEGLSTVKLTLGAARSSNDAGGGWRVDFDDVVCGVVP